MSKITLDYSNAKKFVNDDEIKRIWSEVENAHTMLHKGIGAGNGFLGWLNLPINYNKDEFVRIKKAAAKIQGDSEVLVVIGIGGSYLGSRAAIEFLKSPFYNSLPKDTPDIYYAGNNISPSYHNQIIELIGDRDFSVNVISKSGTTTEPAVAFRIFKELLEKKYGNDGARERIYATTDSRKGVLKGCADAEGYETFAIPDNVGGRFSVLTAVGLLPIAVSGADIDAIIKGAQDGFSDFEELDNDNACYKYAAIRNIFYRKNYTTEILVNYEPSLFYFAQWFTQLFGESEGKENKGIYPAALSFSTDLHSMGQYVQQGLRNLFETVIDVAKTTSDIIIEKDAGNKDGLNFLEGKSMHTINKMAYAGTLLAHTDGGVPNIIINIEKLDEFSLGKLIYFFEKACAISAYILGVNPFDQPGVEEYKKNMFALLGKPGYEELKGAAVRSARKLNLDLFT